MHTLTVQNIVNGDTATNVQVVTQTITLKLQWWEGDPYTPLQDILWDNTDALAPGKQIFLEG